MTAPSDGAVVRGGTVDVRGSVSPSTADVSVLGRPALVTGGRFTVVVPLRPGVNIVDVAASARTRRPAFAALRVTRDVRVTVPDLLGVAEDDVAARLDALGLEADVTRGGDILDVLRSGEPAVCMQEPRAARGCAAATPCTSSSRSAADVHPGSVARRHGDQRDPRDAAVANDTEHDRALDRRPARAPDA